MNHNLNRKKDEETREELKEKIIKILEGAEEEEKNIFKKSISGLEKDLDKIMTESEEDHKKLLDTHFKFRITLITFGGALVAIMINSLDKINYSVYGFIFLISTVFLSLLDLIITYLKEEYHYTDGGLFGEKTKEIISLCRETNYRKDVVEDTKAFIRNVVLGNGKKEPKNIPELIKNFDKENNIVKEFGIKLVWELILVGLLIIGIFFMARDILFHISK